jgi:hypothetical protein
MIEKKLRIKLDELNFEIERILNEFPDEPLPIIQIEEPEILEEAKKVYETSE